MNSFEIGDRDRTSVQPIDTSWRILGHADALDAMSELQFMKEAADPAMYAQSRHEMIDEIWAVATMTLVAISDKGNQSHYSKNEYRAKE